MLNQDNKNSDPNSINLPDVYNPSQMDQILHAYPSDQTDHESELPVQSQEKTEKKRKHPGLWFWISLAVLLVFFTPIRINLLVLGIDTRPGEEWMGRSDTMILTTIPPILPEVKMVSIPRDLWVAIPGHPDNRINTAHYFAEVAEAGTGPQAAADAVEANFGIKFPYSVRLRFDAFKEIVDAMGGVTINLPTAQAGLEAGVNHLDGTQALAFVRDRETSDDFFRQARGQMFIAAAFRQVLNPINWPRIPAVFAAVSSSVQIDLPFWLWPRVGYSLLFSAVKGFNTQSITREMVQPFLTDEGAQVLLPLWDAINPLMKSVFH